MRIHFQLSDLFIFRKCKISRQIFFLDKEGDRFWTSGNDLHKRGDYIWGTTGGHVPLKVPWWLNNNPSFVYGKVQERCIEIAGGKYFENPQPGFVLNDSPCYESKYPICQELIERKVKQKKR